MMYVFAFVFGVVCGAFCMGIASASKDEPMTEDEPISEEDVKELIDYVEKKYKSTKE